MYVGTLSEHTIPDSVISECKCIPTLRQTHWMKQRDCDHFSVISIRIHELSSSPHWNVCDSTKACTKCVETRPYVGSDTTNVDSVLRRVIHVYAACPIKILQVPRLLVTPKMEQLMVATMMPATVDARCRREKIIKRRKLELLFLSVVACRRNDFQRKNCCDFNIWIAHTPNDVSVTAATSIAIVAGLTLLFIRTRRTNSVQHNSHLHLMFCMFCIHFAKIIQMLSAYFSCQSAVIPPFPSPPLAQISLLRTKQKVVFLLSFVSCRFVSHFIVRNFRATKEKSSSIRCCLC